MFLSLKWSITEVSLPEALDNAGEHKLRLPRDFWRRGVATPPCERAGDCFRGFGIFEQRFYT